MVLPSIYLLVFQTMAKPADRAPGSLVPLAIEGRVNYVWVITHLQLAVGSKAVRERS